MQCLVQNAYRAAKEEPGANHALQRLDSVLQSLVVWFFLQSKHETRENECQTDFPVRTSENRLARRSRTEPHRLAVSMRFAYLSSREVNDIVGDIAA